MEGASKSQRFEERLLKFSEDVIVLCKNISRTDVSKPIISQLIRSATSIGANYCEANNASSKRDFKNKIFICEKEARETNYWLRLCTNIADKDHWRTIEMLSKECQEFSLIFQKIISTLNAKKINDK